MSNETADPAPDPAPDSAPDSAGAPRVGERIAKLLARAGIASRREVERMIAEGRVALNGVALDTPATVLRSLHGITVDGEPVAAPPPARLFVYHKPVGLLVTERDPAGRPTIYDRLPAGLPRVVPVGRLDLATEGLLLLTTDGGLKRQLELPATGVERTYRARAYGPVSQAQLEELIHGVEIDGMRYGQIDANLERRTGANGWIEMTLTEGKNREVRRVLEHLGLEVSRLIRTRYGPFVLADLAPGEVGEVRQHDLVAFRRLLKDGGRGARDLRVATLPLPPAAAPLPDGGSERERTQRPARRPASPAAGREPARPDRASPHPAAATDKRRSERPPPKAAAPTREGAPRRDAAPARVKNGGRADRAARWRSDGDERTARHDPVAGERPARRGAPAATPAPATKDGRSGRRPAPGGKPQGRDAGDTRPPRGGASGERPPRGRPASPGRPSGPRGRR